MPQKAILFSEFAMVLIKAPGNRLAVAMLVYSGIICLPANINNSWGLSDKKLHFFFLPVAKYHLFIHYYDQQTARDVISDEIDSVPDFKTTIL